MPTRWTRFVVAFAAALVAWLVATPARASAPLCDPRGATMIAPAPELEEHVTSLDAAAPADDAPCGAALAAGRAWRGGSVPAPELSRGSAPTFALTSDVHPAVGAACGASRTSRASADGERPGERGRVDRPPRA